MPSTTRDISPGSEVGGYRIEGVIGRGGMGVVYRAIQVALDRVVALKVIAPELVQDEGFRERFKRECKTAASIRHPNVIAVHDARDDDGLLFVTMDYIEGTDLRAMVTGGGRLSVDVAVGIVAQTASALDAAHARGLVHRDVKPANILVSSDDGAPHAYLTDFGLTKKVSSESALTGTGMFVGTLDYIAPEQLLGGPVDGRADVYALGCVLFEVLTGSVPFPRDNDMAKLYAHGNLPPPSLRELAPEDAATLDPVVMRAMEKEPDRRYASAGEFARAAVEAALHPTVESESKITRELTEAPTPSPRPPVPRSPPPPRPRPRRVEAPEERPPIAVPAPDRVRDVRPRSRGVVAAWVTAAAGLLLLVLMFLPWGPGGANVFDLHARKPLSGPFWPAFLLTALLPIIALAVRRIALTTSRFLSLVSIASATVAIVLAVQRAAKILEKSGAERLFDELKAAAWVGAAAALVILAGKARELIVTRPGR